MAKSTKRHGKTWIPSAIFQPQKLAVEAPLSLFTGRTPRPCRGVNPVEGGRTAMPLKPVNENGYNQRSKQPTSLRFPFGPSQPISDRFGLTGT